MIGMTEEEALSASSVAFAQASSCFRIRTQPGKAGIHVRARTQGPTEVIFARVPVATAKRFRSLCNGTQSAGVAACLEWLMDELEAQRLVMIVEQA
jgi:hypothetical protein